MTEYLEPGKSMETIKDDLQEIKNDLHKLDRTKQDKVSPGIVITLILYLFGQTVAAAWWAGDLSHQLKTLNERVEKASTDRFYGKDAHALERYFELKLAGVENRLSIVERNQIDCQKKLEKVE